MLTFIMLFLTLLQFAVASPVITANGATDANNSTLVLGNDTYHILNTGPHFKGPWQYNDLECRWVDNFLPAVSTECTEWCDVDEKYNRLRYHITLTGTGQDPDVWCQNFRIRVKFNCGFGELDFFKCNQGPQAPEEEGLRSWVADAWSQSSIQVPGVNLRFDFWGNWARRDATLNLQLLKQHDCVRTAMREATCQNVQWLNGNRCIPVNYRTPEYAASP
ncbi:hypothetical protein F4809DRAFT_660423 [Biscogniauxia mediterranea]|nr:hypothetical protein F4809DRAFT_660423 [Biscogniauxia mediterranea]